MTLKAEAASARQEAMTTRLESELLQAKAQKLLNSESNLTTEDPNTFYL